MLHCFFVLFFVLLLWVVVFVVYVDVVVVVLDVEVVSDVAAVVVFVGLYTTLLLYTTCIYLSVENKTWRSNLQTFLSPFFYFDPYWFCILQLFFRFALSYVPYYLPKKLISLLSSYLYYDMGGPKKCRNIYKFNKYNKKINTTQQ